MSNTDDSLQMILDAILSEYANAGEETADSAVSGEVGEVTSKSAVILLDKLKLESALKLGASRGIEEEFEAAVLRTWRKPLELLDLLLHISLEVGSEFNSGKMSNSSKRSYVKVVLAGQQAKACLIFNEIVHLLKSGFPSGAHSRWRKLHEIACVSYFVSKHGEDMARRFIDYEAVEGYYQAQAILDHQRKMDCEILSEGDFKVLKREFSKVKKRYGPDFVSKAGYPYGWVPREVLKTRSLREIEKAVKLHVLRPYYDVASYNVLGGPNGLMFKMGTVKKGKRAMTPVGPSNYGLADPGKSAAISLGQVMACVLQAESTIERSVIVEALRILVDEICDAFCEIQAEFGKEYSQTSRNFLPAS